MDFKKFPAVQNLSTDGSVCGDVLNHCADYKNFEVAGDDVTSAHEETHGINNALRNRAGVSFGITREDARLIKPAMWDHGPRIAAGVSHYVGSGVNCFYCLKDRYIQLPEPAFRKSDVVPFIPPAYQGFRYPTYVTGQQEWDTCPLYLWDEWSAYINGAVAAVDLVRRNKLPAGGSDWVRAPVEFVAYGLAVCMVADQKGLLDEPMKAAARFMLLRSFNAYLDGKDVFPWDGQDQLYESLKGAPYGDFMRSKLGYDVPTSVQPESPDEPLGKDPFKVIGA